MPEPPARTPLMYFVGTPLKDLVELPEPCSEWREVPVEKASDGGLILYYKDKELRIPKDLIKLSLSSAELQSLALEGLLSRVLGRINRKDFICLQTIVLKLGIKLYKELAKQEAIERVRSRTPSLTAVLAKVIALELGEKYVNYIAVEPSTETIYFKVNGKWIWGTEAEMYLKAKAFEIGNSIVEEIAIRYGLDAIKARSAMTSSVAEEVLKQLKLWSVKRGRDVSELIKEGNKYILVGNKAIDVDYWFEQGILKVCNSNDLYDAIVLHKLPQDEVFMELPDSFESLEDIERVAEVHTPTLLQAMREWVPDPSQRLELWKAMGYTIYPKMPFRKFFLIVGPTGSGKSTFLEFMAYALGFENIASVSLGQLLGSRGEHYAAELYHKLANLADEGVNSAVIERRVRSLEMLKLLVGGSYITARRLYSHPFKFVNYAKLFFATNDEKVVDLLKQDPAVARRMVVIRFKGSFEDNPRFKERLLREAPRALPVLLVALRVLAKNGFFDSSKGLISQIKELCRDVCSEGKNDLFLPSREVNNRLGISAKELCKALRERGVNCKYVKRKGRVGLVLPKDFIK